MIELVKHACKAYDKERGGWVGPSALIHANAVADYIRLKAPALRPEIVSERDETTGLVGIASIRSLYTERPFRPRWPQLGSVLAEIQRHAAFERVPIVRGD